MIKEKNNFEFINFLSLIIIFTGFFVLNSQLQGKFVDKSNQPSVLQATDTSINELNFLYTSSGQRIAKINPNGDNVYYIDPSLEIIVKPDGSVYWRRSFYFAGKLVAVRTNLPVETQTTEDCISIGGVCKLSACSTEERQTDNYCATGVCCIR